MCRDSRVTYSDSWEIFCLTRIQLTHKITVTGHDQPYNDRDKSKYLKLHRDTRIVPFSLGNVLFFPKTINLQFTNLLSIFNCQGGGSF